MIGGFVAAFIITPVHRHRRIVRRDRMGLRHRLPVLHGGDLHPAAGPVREQVVMRLEYIAAAGSSASAADPVAAGSSRSLFRRSEKYYLHLADPDPDLVVHLHRLVDDGPLRPDLARPRRVHRHRRLRHRAAVELRRPHAVDRHSRRDRGGDDRRAAGRLSLLPAAHHRPLFRAADAGAHRVRAARASSACAITPAARSARSRSATATASRSTRSSSSPIACSSYYIALALWLVGLYDLDRGRPQHGPLRARCRQPGRGCRRLGRHRRHAREAEDHRDLGRHVRVRRRDLRPVPDVHRRPTRSPVSASRSTSCSP